MQRHFQPPSSPTVTLSVEEEAIAADEQNQIVADLAEVTQETGRVSDMEATMADARTAVMSTAEVTPVEVQLVAAVADMAVAGTDANPDDVIVIPGEGVTTEGIISAVSSRLASFWKTIRELISKAMDYIVSFFKKVGQLIGIGKQKEKKLEEALQKEAMVKKAKPEELAEFKKVHHTPTPVSSHHAPAHVTAPTVTAGSLVSSQPGIEQTAKHAPVTFIDLHGVDISYLHLPGKPISSETFEKDFGLLDTLIGDAIHVVLDKSTTMARRITGQATHIASNHDNLQNIADEIVSSYAEYVNSIMSSLGVDSQTQEFPFTLGGIMVGSHHTKKEKIGEHEVGPIQARRYSHGAEPSGANIKALDEAQCKRVLAVAQDWTMFLEDKTTERRVDRLSGVVEAMMKAIDKIATMPTPEGVDATAFDENRRAAIKVANWLSMSASSTVTNLMVWGSRAIAAGVGYAVQSTDLRINNIVEEKQVA
jgi:hypothetical protein